MHSPYSNECPREWTTRTQSSAVPDYAGVPEAMQGGRYQYQHEQLHGLWAEILERRLSAYTGDPNVALERWCRQQCRINNHVAPMVSLSDATDIQLQHCIQQLKRWLARLGDAK